MTPDRTWLCLALPRLALDLIDRAQASGPASGAAPRVVIDGPEQRAEVHLADAAAAACGVRAGQRLAAAQALAPALAIHRRDRLAERQMLEHLAGWAYRYTSRVCLEGHDGLLLELGGSARLFGGDDALRGLIEADLAQLGFLGLLGYGATPAAARLRAEVARRDPARSGLLYPLAPIALGDSALDSRAVATLAATGVRTLGELAKLPRAGVARRFGQPVLDYLGRLRGELPEALELYRPPDSYHAWLELPAPCASSESLAFPLRRMLGDLAAVLLARDGGVQHFLLRFALESACRSNELRPGIGDICQLQVGLIEPSRDAAHLYGLTRTRLERMRFPRPVLGIHLEVARLPTLAPKHQDLFGDEGQSSALAPLVERLTARLGEAALLRPQWIADHRPEYASRWRPDAGAPLIRPGDGLPPAAPRPSFLLPEPLPINIDALMLISGAERIESGWWDDDDVRRDYYLAEVVDAARLCAQGPARQALAATVSGGARLGLGARDTFQPSPGARAWVYQDLRQPECWYLHGWFA